MLYNFLPATNVFCALITAPSMWVSPFQAFLAHASPGCVDSTRHRQVLLHQKDRRHTRSGQQAIYCIFYLTFSCTYIILLPDFDLMHSNLSHRGNLFLLTYLMFPVNVLIGAILGIWRMIITALFNIVHMGRMDISLLNRNVEAFDPGERDNWRVCRLESV